MRFHPPNLKFCLPLLAILLALLTSCGIGASSSESPTPTLEIILSAAIPATETATSPSPTETAPPTVPPPTATSTSTPEPTATSTPSETPTETLPPPTPSGDDAIYVYYIQLDTDGPVACGDSVIRANTGVARSGDIEQDVSTALKRLFFKREFIGALYNPVYLSNIEVESVDFKAYEGEVSVKLKGTYVRSGDRCDDSRVRAQVWSTIRQFPGVKTVYILLNDNLLGDILATGK